MNDKYELTDEKNRSRWTYSDYRRSHGKTVQQSEMVTATKIQYSSYLRLKPWISLRKFYKHQGRKPTTLEWRDECRLID